MADVTCTRLSLGAQLRVELDRLKRLGRIDEWQFTCEEPRGIRYLIVLPNRTSFSLAPGHAAAYLNEFYGADVRYGKKP